MTTALEITLSELERRQKAIEEMPLTPQEVTAALQEARLKKWNAWRNEEYWKNQALIPPKQ